MKSLLLFVFPVIRKVFNELRMWGTQLNILPHVLEELHNTRPGKVSRMEDTGLIKELLLHIQVVAPIACLQEGGMVIKTRLEDSS